MVHHRHQTSLETILNFAGPQALPADQRAPARRKFYAIINHCRAAETLNPDGSYSRSLLIRYTYEYARSELSQDTFLRAFFAIMDLDEDLDLTQEGDQLREKLADFAEFLMENFFIPRWLSRLTYRLLSGTHPSMSVTVKATGQRTAQPSPAHLSVIQRVQGGAHEYLPSPDRISVLRGICLMRDHHRCVISRQFDEQEAMERFKRHDENAAQDDEGNPLAGQSFEFLEVAHIIPHSLTKPDADGQLSDYKKAALAVLNMFDCDVSHIISGVDIDRPFNAISLTRGLHTNFGNFLIFFEPVPGQNHTYRIGKFMPAFIRPEIPVTRTLYLVDNKSIEPPSARLLAIHRAIAHILHLSGAGDYIDNILRDMEGLGAHEGGGTELGRIIALRLGGWLDGAVSA
ncbi:hypothetical protein AJ79_06745 [Helicocarpus griseus UAMH5409]|uniref:HNH nuclease domain-containing protein n=1 Tax=Helicocarpus griseus UAMH5409 TaxID=1447875 RepID=A0A2B7XAA4_9EURO|nr:hypothetical protein AJ79_06745 [Helicocarpus griseus UAMH5409]